MKKGKERKMERSSAQFYFSSIHFRCYVAGEYIKKRRNAEGKKAEKRERKFFFLHKLNNVFFFFFHSFSPVIVAATRSSNCLSHSPGS